MKKSRFFTIVGIGVVLLTAGAYVYHIRNTKAYHAKVIISKGNTNGTIQSLVDGFDKEFLKEWAKASRKYDSYFTVNGKKYNTKGGSAAK